MSGRKTSPQVDAKMFSNLPFKWAAMTDKGLCREANEDAYIIEPEIGLFLVSDGMGGHPAGDLVISHQILSVRIFPYELKMLYIHFVHKVPLQLDAC
jgi:serine/threonine protein phosphatase PrpC